MSSVLPDLDWGAPGSAELRCAFWEGAGVSELPSLSLSPSLKPLPGLTIFNTSLMPSQNSLQSMTGVLTESISSVSCWSCGKPGGRLKIGCKDVSSHIECGFGAGSPELGVFHATCTGKLVDSILLGKRSVFFFFSEA